MIGNNYVQEGSSKAGRLEMFFDRSLEPDINKITVEDFLHYFDACMPLYA